MLPSFRDTGGIFPPRPVYDASQGGGFFHRKQGWVPRRKIRTELERVSQKVQRLNFSLWESGVLALGKWGAALLWMELVPLYSPFPYPAWWAFGGFSLGRMEDYFALTSD